MAKVNRQLQAELSWDEIDGTDLSWDKWVALNADPDYIENLNTNSAQEIAKAKGITPDEVMENNYAKYQALREEYSAELENVKEEKQQLLTIRNNLLDSIASVYERADSILTGQDIEVRIGTPNLDYTQDAPAWNDGKVISFNEKLIKDNDENTIMGIHGLNYHELAHLLFTPRIGTELGQWVVDENNKNPQIQTAFNILEDNRAETYLVEKYPATRNFLIATLGDYIINNAEADNLAENFILLAGRRYFSYETRHRLGVAFANKHGADNARLVWLLLNKYRTLVFPRDYNTAKLIIRRLAKLLPEGMPKSPNGCDGRRPLKNGRPISGKEQEALGIKSTTDKPDFTDQQGKGSSPDDNPVSPDGKENGGGIGDGGAEDGNSMSEQTVYDRNAMEALTAEVNKAKENKELQNKVRETQHAITKSNSNKPILSKKPSDPATPSSMDTATARMFAQELEQLRIEADPAWNREKPSGRLNMKRAMNADLNDINKLFDRWEIGNDNHEIEAVLLLDHSGSMYSQIQAVCRSAWIIKRALEQIDGRVTVLAFNHVSKILYTADEKADIDYKSVYTSGGTDPQYALLETERIMLASDKPTKIVILLTDGGFYSKSDEIIERLNEQGCLTCVVYLGNPDYDYNQNYAHKAQVFRAIAEPSDLVVVAKDLVRQRLIAYR